MLSPSAGSSSPVGVQLRHGVEVPGSAPASDANLQQWVDAAQWGFDNLAFVTGNTAALRLWARACELHLHQCYPTATEAERLDKQAAMCREMLEHWHGQHLSGSFEEWHAQAQAQLAHLPQQAWVAGASKTTMAEIEASHAFAARPELLIGYLDDERDRLEREREQPKGLAGYKIGKTFQRAMDRKRRKPSKTKTRGKIAERRRDKEAKEREEYEDEWGF